MKHQIFGDYVQSLHLHLDKGETVYGSGKFVYLTKGNLDIDNKADGGIVKSLQRMVSGETFYMTFLKAKEDGCVVVFSSETAGKIIPLQLTAGKEYICEAESFVAASVGVDLDMHIEKRHKAGFLSGEGFVWQKISGEGMAFVETDGDVEQWDLNENEEILVDIKHLVLIESSVDVEFVNNKELKKTMAKIKGKGKVWIQTFPIVNLAQKVKEVTVGRNL